MAELCVFYLFDQIRRGNAFSGPSPQYVRWTCAPLMIPWISFKSVHSRSPGMVFLSALMAFAIFQCSLILTGMCQQSVQDTGDISVTASDAVYDFDIGVRCFLIIGIILGTVDMEPKV